MAENMKVTLDPLPIKRVEAVEDNGTEHFAPEQTPEEKALCLLRRIDFGQTIEKDSKKENQPTPEWPWQVLQENLQQAHQELIVIIDLIQHVQANNDVDVVMMTRPKQLPNEILSDRAISLSTKFQSFHHTGKYFKQTARSLSQQVSREATFYDALMRLQHNWKIKRQRGLAARSGSNAGFTIDLSDHVSTDPRLGLYLWTSSLCTVCIDQDSAGMLTAHVPGRPRHSVHFGFNGGQSGRRQWECIKERSSSIALTYDDSIDKPQIINQEADEGFAKGVREVVDKGAKVAHSVLREIQCAIFDEQVFEFVTREALHQSPGVNLTGINENFLQLSLSPETTVTIHLISSPSNQEGSKDTEESNPKDNVESIDSDVEMTDGDLGKQMEDASGEKENDNVNKLSRSKIRLPNPLSLEVYLQQIVHQNVFAPQASLRGKEMMMRKAKEAATGSGPCGGQEGLSSNTTDVLRYFCMTLRHRIYCYKVLDELENIAQLQYLHLASHPTWNSCTSAWFLYLDIPQAVINGGQTMISELDSTRKDMRAQFYCKIAVHDESLKIEGEPSPSVGGLFMSTSTEVRPISVYNCGLADLASFLLQQVASQVVYWLYEEASALGERVRKDFLSLSFQLNKTNNVALVAAIDDRRYSINWWLHSYDVVPIEGSVEPEMKSSNESENRKFLGPLPLEALYAVLVDIVYLCCNSAQS